MASEPRPNNDFEPLAPALEEWFGKKFDELPEAVQERVQREWMLAALWDVSSPRRRRNRARQYDIEHHPGLAHEQNVLWEKSLKVAECEQLENRTMSDVKLQETRLRKLRKEEAVAEAVLQQKAKRLGLGWPDDWGDVSPDPKRRGRPPKYDRSRVEIALRERLLVSPPLRYGEQAELERLVAHLFHPDACPAESTIRVMVRDIREATLARAAE